jgi:hypothetical protein
MTLSLHLIHEWSDWHRTCERNGDMLYLWVRSCIACGASPPGPSTRHWAAEGAVPPS